MEKITPHARTVLPTYIMQYYFSSSVILSTNYIAVEQLPHHVFSNCNSLNQFHNRISSLQHIPVNLNKFFYYYLFHNVLLPDHPS